MATTTAGTTLADFFDYSLGIGYIEGTSILFALLLVRLGLWYWSLGSVLVNPLTFRKAEAGFTGPPSCFPKLWAPPRAIG